MHKNIFKQDAINNGFNKFYDGNPCKKGHLAERYTRNSACVQCAIENSKMYDLDYRIKYQKKHKERIKSCGQKYRLKNKKIISEKYAIYKENNKDKLKEKAKEYRIINADKNNKRTKEWALNNPEKAKINSKISQANRRARKLKATPQWANLNNIKNIYLNCPKGFEVDHIIPLGSKIVCGLHIENNLQYLDKLSNRKKAASLIF